MSEKFLKAWLDKFFSAEVVAGKVAFLFEPLFHDDLGGDSCVVTSRIPQSRLSVHAMPSNDTVLDGHCQRVSQVQRSSHVRRRDHDGKVALWVIFVNIFSSIFRLVETYKEKFSEALFSRIYILLVEE